MRRRGGKKNSKKNEKTKKRKKLQFINRKLFRISLLPSKQSAEKSKQSKQMSERKGNNSKPERKKSLIGPNRSLRPI